MTRFRYLVAILPLLAACNREPAAVAPPPQREAKGTTQDSTLGPYASMSDLNAAAYIVGGISPATEAGSWRWAYKRPQLRFFLREVKNLTFSMDFAIADVTFKETGPVTVSVLVNDKPLGKKRYDRPGRYVLEIPAPQELLRVDALNTVTIEPDKVFTAKADGAQLGLILAGAGFRD